MPDQPRSTCPPIFLDPVPADTPLRTSSNRSASSDPPRRPQAQPQRPITPDPVPPPATFQALPLQLDKPFLALTGPTRLPTPTASLSDPMRQTKPCLLLVVADYPIPQHLRPPNSGPADPARPASPDHTATTSPALPVPFGATSDRPVHLQSTNPLSPACIRPSHARLPCPRNAEPLQFRLAISRQPFSSHFRLAWPYDDSILLVATLSRSIRSSSTAPVYSVSFPIPIDMSRPIMLAQPTTTTPPPPIHHSSHDSPRRLNPLRQFEPQPTWLYHSYPTSQPLLMSSYTDEPTRHIAVSCRPHSD